ncbi:hypothetical protein [Caulobacter sp. UNC358MFTsu5.1]|uniref:hypothetical protein n=1 Tax=Caulobacter sp. UNC358MFTsu5.1 TaxID=1449049 RepID=UPI0004A744A2|nr:hypothetical protein [Caulobacter sp. UNC358MFTsu5.1]
MAAASGEAVDPTAVALRAAAVHSAALVLVSAAQHVQRTTVLVEAATVRTLIGAAGEVDRELAVARAALAEAMGLFEAAQAQARTLTAELGGT